jgi:hypothetical protein
MSFVNKVLGNLPVIGLGVSVFGALAKMSMFSGT